MTGVLRFPRLGSEKTLALFEKPTKDENEYDADYTEEDKHYALHKGISVTVKLVSRETSRAWSMRWQSITDRDKQRLEQNKKRGESSPEITQEGVSELIKLQRDILSESLVKVSGLEYGETLLESVSEIPLLIECVDGCGLLSAMSICATRAQTPTPTQGKD